MSSFGIVLALAVITASAWQWGALTVAAYYGVPLLIVNANLVLITLLQVRRRGL